ncbi:hypothetical protein DFH06DRAFT_1317605 [Mycena polygramma]|nr:hypothetical protein DFH06DRAFT_1317605 [Mycena polygramma]
MQSAAAAYAPPPDSLIGVYKRLVCCSTRAHWAPIIRAYRHHRTAHPDQHEGKGSVYLQANVDDEDLRLWRTGAIDDPALIARTALKAGYTDCLPRRQRQYRRCEQGERTIVWMAAYHVARRCYVERFVHLRLFKHGGLRVRFPCPCYTSHREYMWLDSIRGLAAVDSRVVDVLLASGEQMDRETLPCPDVNGDFYDLILNS